MSVVNKRDKQLYRAERPARSARCACRVRALCDTRNSSHGVSQCMARPCRVWCVPCGGLTRNSGPVTTDCVGLDRSVGRVSRDRSVLLHYVVRSDKRASAVARSGASYN